MKVKFPLIIEDQLATQSNGMPPVEHLKEHREDFFLDGPVTKRVAVLDFNSLTGELVPGVRFQRPADLEGVGRYEIKDERDLNSPDFNQVSVFATVLKTMYMFEEADTLGRPLTWAFNAPQLLIVPRAGEWANAYYERETHSLQFFYFYPEFEGGVSDKPIYSSLSHDIVCHETGHAILDGIAPDLYNCISPQALALHEAVADLTAFVMALRSDPLRRTVIRHTGGDLRQRTALSRVAEEFGHGRDPHAEYLRSLFNQRTLDPQDESKDAFGKPNRVPRDEPHDLSEVLSGALYNVLVNIFESNKEQKRADGKLRFDTDTALWASAERFKRMILRSLDYLPPGEVSFADYGRAIIASDQASHPNEAQERQWICDEFIKRHMALDENALKVATNFDAPELAAVNLQTLADSDWAAYEFANNNRKFLGVPEGVNIRVRPRLDTKKKYYRGNKQVEYIRELIFKVSWDYKEPNKLGRFFPDERQITIGTTLAIDWSTKRVRALLTSDFSEKTSGRGGQGEKERALQQGDRDTILTRLADEGILQLAGRAMGPDSRPIDSVVRAEASDNLMRVRGAARMLHII
ncbi:MAG TPA: hypothetical protein VM095_05795 [Pyrinomonadaceae bacterium]|nr:hypothetical protein [Pyrinomonadaceae bacterium]